MMYDPKNKTPGGSKQHSPEKIENRANVSDQCQLHVLARIVQLQKPRAHWFFDSKKNSESHKTYRK